MAEENIPAATAAAPRKWQWSWWKALLGAVGLIVVAGGGLQGGTLNLPTLWWKLAFLWTLPLTIFFAGVTIYGWAYHRSAGKLTSETMFKIAALTGAATLSTYALVSGTPQDETCKFGDHGLISSALEQKLGDPCLFVVSGARLLQHYTTGPFWLAGLLTGAIAGTGLYWIFPHRVKWEPIEWNK